MRYQKVRSLIFLHSILFLTLNFSGCLFQKDSKLNRPDCPAGQALCPQDPTQQTQTDFCQVNYQRDLEYLSQCGPVKPGPICQANACQATSSLTTNPTPFDSENTCYAMSLILAGIGESLNGTWNTSAPTNLGTALKNESVVTVALSSYGGLRYFYFVDQYTQWIVFLGSKTLANWKVDAQYSLVDFPDMGMKIHDGFLQTTQSVYEIIKTSIDNNSGKKIRLAGHSLGGAVATTLALMLTAEKYTVETLITFGQPQITDASGAAIVLKNFPSVPLMRIINNNDRVPFLTGSLNKDYSQFGPEIWLETATAPATFALLPEPDNTRTLASVDQPGTADHQPAAYAASLNTLFCRGNYAIP